MAQMVSSSAPAMTHHSTGSPEFFAEKTDGVFAENRPDG